MWHGLIDYRLGMILGATMFIGAAVGARFAIRIGNVWVWALGLKALVLDLFGKNSGSAGTPYMNSSCLKIRCAIVCR